MERRFTRSASKQGLLNTLKASTDHVLKDIRNRNLKTESERTALKKMPKRKAIIIISDDEEEEPVVAAQKISGKRKQVRDVNDRLAVAPNKQNAPAVPISVRRMSDWFEKVHEDTLGEAVRKQNPVAPNLSPLDGAQSTSRRPERRRAALARAESCSTPKRPLKEEAPELAATQKLNNRVNFHTTEKVKIESPPTPGVRNLPNRFRRIPLRSVTRRSPRNSSEAKTVSQAIPEAEIMTQALPKLEIMTQALPEAEIMTQALPEAEIMAQALPEAEVMTQALPEVAIMTQALPEAQIMTQVLPSARPTCPAATNATIKTEMASPKDLKFNRPNHRSPVTSTIRLQKHLESGAVTTGQQHELRSTSRDFAQSDRNVTSELSRRPGGQVPHSSSEVGSSTAFQMPSEFRSAAIGEPSCLPFTLNVEVTSSIPTKLTTVQQKKQPLAEKTAQPRRLALRKSKSPGQKSSVKRKSSLKRLKSAIARAAKPSTVRIKTEPVTPEKATGQDQSRAAISTLGKTEHPPVAPSTVEVAESDVINVDQQAGNSRMADGLWDIYELVSNKVGVNYTTVKRVVQMLEQGATLPFICRYRREQSGGLSSEAILMIQEEHKQLLQVRKKAEALSAKLMAQGRLTEAVREAIFSAKSCDELDLVAEPFKASGPRTLAGKARCIGLEPAALSFWRGEKTLPELGLVSLIDPAVQGKRDWAEVTQSIQYILADELRKDRAVLDAMDGISRSPHVMLVVKKKKASTKAPVNPNEREEKFLDYFQFQRNVTVIDSHQVLAINRGENLGFLSVTVQLSDFTVHSLKDVLRRRFRQYHTDPASHDLIERTISDCVERLCKPYLTRIVRAQLKERADKEAIKVFASNLRSLLMTPPVRGEAVLGIDPGFANGCKMAMLSRTGELLAHGVIYPDRQPETAKRQLAELVRLHQCNLVAVGDGKGSQQVKALISACSREGRFGSQRVRFSTIREAGVSIYSVTAEAEKEFPGLDSFVKSAVAIARRLQDPLIEYVKVEPRHLGIGMYQHDTNEAKLKEALQATVVECVSFVGVDLNVCPEFLLRQVAGLNATAARNVIEYREKYGPFMNREQLQLVPHIGPTRYEQCAGFVKILPETVQRCLDESVVVTRVQKPNMKRSISEEFEPLDTTIIHPESYATARTIIADLGLDVSQVGTPDFIKVVTRESTPDTTKRFVAKLGATAHTVEFILKALAARRDSDLRDEGSAPIFSETVCSINDIRPGDIVRGKVMNVVPFGAFVDIGLENDVLLPSRFMSLAAGKLRTGDAIEGRVMSVELARKRVSLSFVRFL